ncbi:spermidine/putrescine ABC transporter permease [Spiroplasma endosymbiont of Amphibalanus improvisus]|uniref:spermidine/putrescine ABC transporter permease n=1 Tax=Spiroplasma endosymbiont of Amphibalanus improvisus TaxID=3066327 RepID=UPI00313BCD33
MRTKNNITDDTNESIKKNDSQNNIVKNSSDLPDLDKKILLATSDKETCSKKIKFQNMLNSVKKSKTFNFTTKKITPLLWPYILIAVFLIVIPMFLIFLYSIITPTGDGVNFLITFTNFINFFTSPPFLVSLGLTILLSFIATIIAIIIAYPVAFAMSCMNSKTSKQNIWIIITTPIWINMILKMIGLETLFKLIAPGLLGTAFSVVIGMIYAFVPFVILPIYSSLERVDQNLVDASKDLGASNSKTFWKITFRESVPGIIAGFVIMFVQAATSLVVVQYMGQGKINLLVQIIESYFFKGVNYGMGASISVIFAVLLGSIILVSSLWKKRFDITRVNKNNKKKEMKINEKILEI